MKEKIIGTIITYLLYLLRATYKVEVKGMENRLRAAKDLSKESDRDPVLIAFFHEHLVGAAVYHMGQKIAIIISASKDGDIATEVAVRTGLIPIRGSTGKKGAASSQLKILDHLRSGTTSALTIDGPKGPRRVCKPGIVLLSSRSRVPILPLIVTFSNVFTFKKSWDQFKLPIPFSKVTLHYGEPISIPENLDKDAYDSYQTIVSDQLIKLEQSTI